MFRMFFDVNTITVIIDCHLTGGLININTDHSHQINFHTPLRDTFIKETNYAITSINQNFIINAQASGLTRTHIPPSTTA